MVDLSLTIELTVSSSWPICMSNHTICRSIQSRARKCLIDTCKPYLINVNHNLYHAIGIQVMYTLT